MRIIGGKFKGKKLILPYNKKTRPLKDVVKESIFNLIVHSRLINIDIENSNVLDLFSGSGSFGLECISRGARSVYFFENYNLAIKTLKKNISLFNDQNKIKIFENDCFNSFDKINHLNLKFDIIFIDPPFREQKINIVLNKIIENKLLKKNGIIIIHRHKKDTVSISKKLKIFDTRKYGLSKIIFGN